MEEAEALLRDAGLDLPLVTSNALLGTRLLPLEREPRRAVHRTVLDLASELTRRLGERAAASPGLELQVSLHVDQALVRGPASALEIAGGPIMHILDWPLEAEVEGVRVSGAGRPHPDRRPAG